jgi:hypothetical protein
LKTRGSLSFDGDISSECIVAVCRNCYLSRKVGRRRFFQRQRRRFRWGDRRAPSRAVQIITESPVIEIIRTPRADSKLVRPYVAALRHDFQGTRGHCLSRNRPQPLVRIACQGYCGCTKNSGLSAAAPQPFFLSPHASLLWIVRQSSADADWGRLDLLWTIRSKGSILDQGRFLAGSGCGP